MSKIKLTTPYSKYPVGWPKIDKINEESNTLPCTFLGSNCQQSFNAFFMWEKVLSPLKFKRFIELGTGHGNTSVYFKMFCINKGAKFYTYDFGENKRENTKAQKYVKIANNYIIKDIFKEAKNIKNIISREGISVVFCDGGDKPHELRTFAPALKRGDIIACHDWGRAIKDEWVAEDIKKNNLKELYRNQRIKLNTVTGIFVKE
jgi:cephalosporin hydroxylase